MNTAGEDDPKHPVLIPDGHSDIESIETWDNWMWITNLKDHGAGSRHLIQLRFNRCAAGPAMIAEKRAALIRDVMAWLGGLEGEDAVVRDGTFPISHPCSSVSSVVNKSFE